MATPSIPPTVGADGKAMGARVKPRCLSLCCFPSCAISGYETGDPWEGICRGPAFIALLGQIFCGVFAGIFAVFAWKPDPSKIVGDGTQRTVNNKCCTVCCLGAPCTIAFWERGDLCTGLCEGDAGVASCLTVLGSLISLIGIPVPLGPFFGCCCWKPNPLKFKRTADMDGGESGLVGNPVVLQAQVVGQQVPQPQKMSNAVEEASLEAV